MRKKLSLDVDALRVESFVAGAEAAAARGTVRGNAATVLCTLTCPPSQGNTCGINGSNRDALATLQACCM
jgi:hypothetical protein